MSKKEPNEMNEADEGIFSSENEENCIESNEDQDNEMKQSTGINTTSCSDVKEDEKDTAQEPLVGNPDSDAMNKVEEIAAALADVVISNESVSQSDIASSRVEENTVKEEKVHPAESQHSGKQVYRLKWIEWHNKKTPIVTQNENGPCPLIAVANILLLRGKIQLRASTEFITADDLMDYIGDAIMESIPKDLQGASMLNYEQNMHDAIAILPQLHTGLDVNIKFTGVQHFEYTPECIIFDLLNIPLYHGWLVDPQCAETVKAVGNLGYNQLVERIILNKCASDADLITEALIAEQFLERTASQLTYHGLCELNLAMKQEELAVLFRNNHFSTILKKKLCMDRGDASPPQPAREELHELFQLVTDQGFLHEPRVVWETLSNIEGDGQFVDCRFATVPPKAADCFIPDGTLTEEQQINQDEELARRIQEQQHTQQLPGRAPSPAASASGRLPSSPGGERGRKGAVCNVI